MDETLEATVETPAESAAAIAATSAAVAASDAAAAAEVVAAENETIDPALLAAEVELNRQQEETERARIDARMQIKIAEIQAEQNEWRSNIEASLTRLEGMITTMIPQSLTPEPPPAATVTVIENPEAPVITEPSGTEPPAENPAENPAVVVPEAPAQEAPAEAPPARKRRWI